MFTKSLTTHFVALVTKNQTGDLFLLKYKERLTDQNLTGWQLRQWFQYLQVLAAAVQQSGVHPRILAEHDVVVRTVPHHQQLGAQGHPKTVGDQFKCGRVGLGGDTLAVAADGHAERNQPGLGHRFQSALVWSKLNNLRFSVFSPHSGGPF